MHRFYIELSKVFCLVGPDKREKRNTKTECDQISEAEKKITIKEANFSFIITVE